MSLLRESCANGGGELDALRQLIGKEVNNSDIENRLSEIEGKIGFEYDLDVKFEDLFYNLGERIDLTEKYLDKCHEDIDKYNEHIEITAKTRDRVLDIAVDILQKKLDSNT